MCVEICILLLKITENTWIYHDLDIRWCELPQLSSWQKQKPIYRVTLTGFSSIVHLSYFRPLATIYSDVRKKGIFH